MTPFSTKGRRARALLAAAVLVTALPASTMGAQGHPHPATAFVALTGAAPAGSSVVPLINSGDMFDGVKFEGIPDGLGIMPVGNGKHQIDIFVAFEQSHVPFGGFADFEDSSVQRARLDLKSGQIVGLQEMLPPSAGFIRFCSANMLGPSQGFSDYTFIVNEESNDVLPVLAGQPYGSDPVWSAQNYRQAGYSVYLDAKTGAYKTIPGAGRVNHENTMVVPGGWSDVIALTGDDTFTAPGSQLYMYGASSPGAFKQDKGSLWAFRVTSKNGTPVTAADPFNGANDYLDIAGSDILAGTFIPVPDDIARGTAGGFPQTDLENWSNANNVFQFVRIEDIAYDPDSPRTVYFADTGTTRLKDTGSGRLSRVGATAFPYVNTDGRVFKLVLNAADPMVVDSLQILGEGLLAQQTSATTFTVLNAGVGILQPDNLDVGHNSIMVQEDNGTPIAGQLNNDVWQYSLGADIWTKVASATQTATAETSGIVDASNWLGAGWWVLDVQSHINLELGASGLSYQPLPSGTPLTYQLRRELGQLLLLYLPGS